MSNPLRDRLRSGQPAINGWVSGDSTYLAETLARAGYDAITVDLQHGLFGLDGGLRVVMALSAGPAVVLARCPDHSPATIGKLLDAGALGIICPAVDSPELAARFVASCRYPPAGVRSFGPARALFHGADYVERSAELVLTWAMVESRAALDSLPGIIATPGLDAVYVGPNDLAMSLGLTPSGARGPELREALTHVVTTAHAAGRFAGVFCADAEVAGELLDLGYDMVTPGNDATILREGAMARVRAIREHSSGAVQAESSGISTSGY